MEQNTIVKIEVDRLVKTEYLIKDKDNIMIGRFTTSELGNDNKICNISLSFYREDNYELLNQALVLILRAIFKYPSIFKVNVKVSEKIDVNSFLDLGFTLEGVFSQNQYFKGEYYDELSFGMTRTEYAQMNRYPIVELTGTNISLRNLTSGDAEKMLEYYKKNKKHLDPFEPSKDSNFYTLEGQKKFLNKSYKEFFNGTSVEFGIFKEENLIGKIKLSRILHGSFKNGMLGYSIDEDEQGKGYMKESVKLLLNYAFCECELHRIEASALVNNMRSRGVLISCGFKLVGINEKYLLINGKWEDHATYYIVKEDFEKEN